MTMLQPRAADLAWMERGNCLPFPYFTEWPVKDQLAICRGGCPVMTECAALGLVTPMYDPRDLSVWGGMTPYTRWTLQHGRTT